MFHVIILLTLIAILTVPTLSYGDSGDVPEFILSIKQAARVVIAQSDGVAKNQKVELPLESNDTSETIEALTVSPSSVEPMPSQAIFDDLMTIGVKGERKYTSANSMLAEINSQRSAKGLSKLTMNASYLEPAMQAAAEVSVYFDWEYGLRPNGEDFFDLYPAPWIGMTFGYLNGSSAKTMLNTFMSDSSIKSVLLDPAARSVGIGCFKLNGFYFWTIYVSPVASTAAAMPADKVVVAPVQIEEWCVRLFSSPQKVSLQETKTIKMTLFADVPNWAKLPLEASYMNFFSLDPSVATVNSGGTITGQSPGKAKLLAQPKDHSNQAAVTDLTVTQIKYTIKFYNGSTLIKTASVARNASLPTSFVPAKTGHSFIGWYSTGSGGTLVEKATKNQTVYARYKAKVYTVNFYNGDTLVETKSVSYNKAPIAGPKKTGYTFVGWFTAKSGGTQVTKIVKNQTLYARYKINQYTTNYYSGSTLVKTVKANYNTNVIAGPKKTGYTFVGWFTAKTGGTQITKINANRTLYARYQINTYMVKYMFEGSQIATGTVQYNKAPMAGPAKEGYNFTGWFTSATAGTKVTAITKNQTLYARHAIKKYTVNYYDGAKLIKTVMTNHGKAPIAGPAKTGYTFDGWFTAKTGGTQVTAITKAQTLYARYTIKTFTIEYYNEIGTPLGTEVLKYGSPLSKTLAPATTSAYPGCGFDGWYDGNPGPLKFITKATKNQSVYASYSPFVWISASSDPLQSKTYHYKSNCSKLVAAGSIQKTTLNVAVFSLGRVICMSCAK